MYLLLRFTPKVDVPVAVMFRRGLPVLYSGKKIIINILDSELVW